MMEGTVPEYDRKGKIRGPSGSSITGIVPTNAYPCLPSPIAPEVPSFIIIGGNSDSIYNRMMTAIERTDLIGPDYLHNDHRVARREEIEKGISEWTRTRTAEEAEEVFRNAGVPAGRVLSVKEIVESEHLNVRGMIEEVYVEKEGGEGWNVKVPHVVPLLEGSNAHTRWAGPELGQHTEEVLLGDLGLSMKEFEQLKDSGIIG
jgi:crotonobetainyl-CoA:carnitine CoA-transferase CaiB-like acyl-CoA transferase